MNMTNHFSFINDLAKEIRDLTELQASKQGVVKRTSLHAFAQIAGINSGHLLAAEAISKYAEQSNARDIFEIKAHIFRVIQIEAEEIAIENATTMKSSLQEYSFRGGQALGMLQALDLVEDYYKQGVEE